MLLDCSPTKSRTGKQLKGKKKKSTRNAHENGNDDDVEEDEEENTDAAYPVFAKRGIVA